MIPDPACVKHHALGSICPSRQQKPMVALALLVPSGALEAIACVLKRSDPGRCNKPAGCASIVSHGVATHEVDQLPPKVRLVVVSFLALAARAKALGQAGNETPDVADAL